MRWSNVGLFVAIAGVTGVFGLAYRTFSAPSLQSPAAPAVVMVAEPFNGLLFTQTRQRVGVWAKEAADNYQRLLKDQLPIGTCRDAGAFSDGGTRLWECTGYSLRLQKSIASVAGQEGYLYGPALTIGPNAEVSHVEFYTQEALAKRLGIKGGL
ncbi:hypothetical protein [Lysobacter sp. Root667]|uniref:hypothetical protein n=1 Tax=Lysobacter sp. Root667 TaxID=1736581 RepID=UPI0012DCEFC4|nr:hypothetical protein [Lysobacter sp. Root667]